MALDPRLGAVAVGTGDPLAQITQELADLRRRIDALERGGTGNAQWTAVSFNAGFSAYVPTYYRRDSNGIVHIDGAIQYTSPISPATIFTLPVGSRPGDLVVYDGACDSAPRRTARISIFGVDDAVRQGQVQLTNDANNMWGTIAGLEITWISTSFKIVSV